MEAVVERLARLPQLGLIYRELTDFWDKERKVRQDFYDSIQDGQKVEFINGQIIMHSPDTVRHSEVRHRIAALLRVFAARHRLGKVIDEKGLICLSRNDYMPDVVFFRAETAAELTPEQLQLPAPDLVVEVLSPSTSRRDRGVKFDDYAAHGVEEYWIVDPAALTVECFKLGLLGKYLATGKFWSRQDDSVRSEAMTGFVVSARAFFEDEANLEALKTLLK